MKNDKKFPDERDKSLPTLLVMLLGGILLSVGSLALIGYFVGRAKKREDEIISGSSNRENRTGGFKCLSNSYPLQLGTCHVDVKILQQYLKKLGADLGAFGKNKDGIDGQFGTYTQKAAVKYLGKEIFNDIDMQAMRKQL